MKLQTKTTAMMAMAYLRDITMHDSMVSLLLCQLTKLYED